MIVPTAGTTKAVISMPGGGLSKSVVGISPTSLTVPQLLPKETLDLFHCILLHLFHFILFLRDEFLIQTPPQSCDLGLIRYESLKDSVYHPKIADAMLVLS